MSKSARRIALAALALGAWGAHVVVMWRVYGGSPEELLWACHLAPLLLALGCALDRREVVGVAATWITFGTMLWLGDAIAVAALPVSTAIVVHVGTLLLAWSAVRVVGWDRGAWWRASLAIFALAATTRLLGIGERFNVNLMFRVWRGWEPIFGSHLAFVVFLALAVPLAFYVVGRGLERLAAARR